MGKNCSSIIINVLTKLGVNQPAISFKNLRREHLKALEKKYNIVIPKEYKEFLESYDETFFEKEIIYKPIEPSPVMTKEGKQYFDGFYGLMSENNINQQIESYENRIPGNLVPIGECPAGNLICIGVNEPVFGKIYFWNHENELEAKLMIGEKADIENIDSYWDNVYLISESFVDFLNNLEIEDEFENEDVDVEEVDLWLDDDLMDD
ncbi:SMI1/KNR4 family protein [Lentibacillus sp. Marseille-P4043]|uniref:SMI1/KNR4 family protein n=1 Tax=Lentibacillus sp. Marseille-P4043 TaxID=2040293 RepID=UPI000D0B19CF|nr:SMI1/KNR4 family protein [Lentibacillus sp. Marseille-P4043]